MPARRILVTGGAGYIGSHCAMALLEHGYEVVVLDNLSNGHRDYVESSLQVPFVEGDTTDSECLNAVFGRFKFDAVFHFAAFSLAGESVRFPQTYYRNNVVGTLNLLDSMRKAGVSRFVFSSTCATYGIPERMPITEDTPQHPINPYGETKLVVERMLRDFDTAHDLKHVSLRYFNAAGADPEARIGEHHDPETHLIPLVLDVAIGKRDRIEIFGTDYPTHDGTCVRDYVHVCDLAEAHIRGLEYLLDGNRSDAFNLGTGRGHSVREIVGACQAVTGREIKTSETVRRPGDPPTLVASSEKAHRVLSWKPAYAAITETVSHAWKWHQKLQDRLAANPEP